MTETHLAPTGMRGLLLALASALLFAVSVPASKALLDGLGVFQLAGLLYVGAAVGSALGVAREAASRTREGREVVRWPGIGRRNRMRLAGAVFLGGAVAPVLLLQALRLTLAGSVALLLNLELAATAVLGVLLFREPLGRTGALGVAGVIAAGVVISSGGGWPGWLAASLVAAACLCWGLDNHLTALIDGLTPSQSTFCKGVVAGTVNLGLGLAIEPWTASPQHLATAILLGALSYGVSIALYIASAQELGATRAQAIFASAPFLAAALSFAALGESLLASHCVAALLLVASSFLMALSRHHHEHTHEAAAHLHAHRHDDGHHDHEHPGLPRSTRHSHWHRHAPRVHSHPHWPDLHHRHSHRILQRAVGETGSAEPGLLEQREG